jgi:hypothetical protein
MNKIAMTMIAAALGFSAPVIADDAHAHHQEPAADAKSAPAEFGPQVKRMQANLRKMQPQLERLAKAKTDADRQKALAEHMHTMKENMDMARGMQAGKMECPMMEGGMGKMGKGGGMGMMGGGMGAKAGDAAAGAVSERMQQMEKRMDMMQSMMEHMMRRQEGAPPAPVPAR